MQFRLLHFNSNCVRGRIHKEAFYQLGEKVGHLEKEIKEGERAGAAADVVSKRGEAGGRFW